MPAKIVGLGYYGSTARFKKIVQRVLGNCTHQILDEQNQCLHFEIQIIASGSVKFKKWPFVTGKIPAGLKKIKMTGASLWFDGTENKLTILLNRRFPKYNSFDKTQKVDRYPPNRIKIMP